MRLQRIRTATCLLLAAPILFACQQQKAKPAKTTIGHHVTELSVRVGGTWQNGYTVDVDPEEYVVVEHKNCPQAKRRDVPEDSGEGLCVVRITKDQSNRFEAAMERFKRNAIPFESYSFEDPNVRPDGKPCRSEVTDSTFISLMWTGTQGVKIANFYTGCDEEEFKDFYKAVLAVTDPLPIQNIIKEK